MICHTQTQGMYAHLRASLSPFPGAHPCQRVEPRLQEARYLHWKLLGDEKFGRALVDGKKAVVQLVWGDGRLKQWAPVAVLE